MGMVTGGWSALMIGASAVRVPENSYRGRLRRAGPVGRDDVDTSGGVAHATAHTAVGQQPGGPHSGRPGALVRPGRGHAARGPARGRHAGPRARATTQDDYG